MSHNLGNGGAHRRSPGAFEHEGAPTPYPAYATPDKEICFMVDGNTVRCAGQIPAMARALVAAGPMGVEHRQCWPWSLNPGDLISALRKRGAKIRTIRGKPCRWVLISDVVEVRP